MKSILNTLFFLVPQSGQIWLDVGHREWVIREAMPPREGLKMAILPAGTYINIETDILTHYVRTATPEELDKYGLTFI